MKNLTSSFVVVAVVCIIFVSKDLFSQQPPSSQKELWKNVLKIENEFYRFGVQEEASLSYNLQFSNSVFMRHGNDTLKVSKHKRNLYFGLEHAELSQNNYRNLGIHNYTIFLGQRFWFKGWQKFGWRFLSINVELSEPHLASIPFFKGNTKGFTGKLNVERIYLDYYIIDLKWKFIHLAPVVSTGLGYIYHRFTNTRFNESASFGSLCLPIAFRLPITFFNTIFIEYFVLDASLHPRRPKEHIGDTFVDFPEYWSGFSWLNIGIKIEY